MKTIQQYFDATFKKSSVVITVPKISEELQGETLMIEDYLNLTRLNLRELPQVKEIIIKNCPKLTKIIYNHSQQEKPIIIQPEKKGIDWPCIVGITLSLVAIALHLYRFFKRKRTKN